MLIDKLVLSLLFIATYYIGFIVGLEVEQYKSIRWLFLVIVCVALFMYT